MKPLDNYDANFPHGVSREAFHSMGSMVTVVNPKVQTPQSMYSGGYQPPERPLPSTSGARQITIPESASEHKQIEYLPAPRGTLYLNTEKTTFVLSEECQLKVRQQNELTLALCCVRQHSNCPTEPSLKVMMRDLGQQPEEKSLYFHLDLLHDDPSILPTVRKLLGKIELTD